MSYRATGTIYKTYVLKSESGKQFKYEILQWNDGSSITATISCLDALPGQVSSWVVVNHELYLNIQNHHPEYALDEIREHFSENYAQE
ncbi:hypothetical protein ACDX32_01530 [Klebsiella quasipneumoniae]|uniref:hypothetical protein n=1 Tax=Klebsiella quasipneumoniae TaxID=1463165 RepID=UPI00355675CF